MKSGIKIITLFSLKSGTLRILYQIDSAVG